MEKMSPPTATGAADDNFKVQAVTSNEKRFRMSHYCPFHERNLLTGGGTRGIRLLGY